MKTSQIFAAVFATAVLGTAGTYLFNDRSDEDFSSADMLAGDNTLTVRAAGVRNTTGSVVVSVCAKGQEFPASCSLKDSVLAKEGETVVEFSDLADGQYAVALFHDENADGALSFQQEGIGFSRNANLEFSMPDFEKSMFSLPETPSIIVNLKYYN